MGLRVTGCRLLVCAFRVACLSLWLIMCLVGGVVIYACLGFPGLVNCEYFKVLWFDGLFV